MNARLKIGLAVTGVAAVAGAAYAFMVRNKRAPLRGACPPGDHVGTPGYVWPYPEAFIDQNGFGEALESLGYDAGDWSSISWEPCGNEARRATSQFQDDFNLIESVRLGTPGPVGVTGLIDNATIEAIVFAHNLQVEGSSWPMLVGEARVYA